VARNATLDFHHFMFEYKGPGIVHVVLEADGVLCRGRSQLPRQEAAVRIVAVSALHECFIL